MSETDLGQFREVEPEGRFTQQNSSLLKVRLDGDEVRAKQGSMVAYRATCASSTRAAASDVSSRGQRPAREWSL